MNLPAWFIVSILVALPVVAAGSYLGGPLGAAVATVGGQITVIAGIILAVTYRNGKDQ